MVHLVGGSGRLDVSAEWPEKLTKLELVCFRDMSIIVEVLRLSELSAEFIMKARETSGEIAEAANVAGKPFSVGTNVARVGHGPSPHQV